MQTNLGRDRVPAAWPPRSGHRARPLSRAPVGRRRWAADAAFREPPSLPAAGDGPLPSRPTASPRAPACRRGWDTTGAACCEPPRPPVAAEACPAHARRYLWERKREKEKDKVLH
ncbi:unnamed protein product [Urochloa humidicola]